MTARTSDLLPATAAAILCLACLLPGGCTDKKKVRAGVAFHAQGVRVGVRRVREEITRPARKLDGEVIPGTDFYSMKTATDHLARALRGLPARIERKAASRKAERKAAAEKAKQLFIGLRPVLESLRYDKGEALAKLDEIASLMGEVERP